MNNRPFKPFPKLWEAFQDESKLLEGQSFDKLFDASKALAMHGVEDARRILARGSA